MIDRFIKSLVFRRRWKQLGVRYLRSSAFNPETVVVSGKKIHLRFPDNEKDILRHELGKIFYDDCYGLEKLSEPPATILDIGGNVGLFSLVARHRFPHAQIHCYEPNPDLKPNLQCNLGALDVKVFHEAVGPRSGRVEMRKGENSLHSASVTSGAGAISMSPLETAVQRIGGRVDLLKLDCEGMEWEILERDGPWESVQEITMEYHLWSRPESRLSDLISLLENRRFVVVDVRTDSNKTWGLVRAKKP
jgi:FkbM family methyltransferase